VCPVAAGAAPGATVATATGWKTTAAGGSTTTPLQRSEHVAVMAFSSPAQPLHLPDMGMSDMGMPDMSMPVSVVAAAVAAGAASSMAMAWTERTASPAAKATESTIATSRRVVSDHMHKK
jgi:hypothetical protein